VSALFPLLVIVVQAGSYWLSARSWVERASMPVALAAAYRVFLLVDSGLLVVGLLGVLVWWPDHLGVAIAALAVWVFGVVEYVKLLRRLPDLSRGQVVDHAGAVAHAPARAGLETRRRGDPVSEMPSWCAAGQETGARSLTS
jgi:hypothetical protein